MVFCDCSCGTKIEITVNRIRSGNTVSCGCFRSEKARKKFITHSHTLGKHHSPTYASWSSMLTRCTNPNRSNYAYYGGRGIKVCERWIKFENFLADMGVRPQGHTLGRIDNNSDYCQENCQWETHKQQMRNTTRNKIYKVRGITASLPQLCEHFGVQYHRTRARIGLGWNIDDALFKDLGSRKEAVFGPPSSALQS